MLPRQYRLTTKEFKEQKKGEYVNTPLFRVKIIKDTKPALGIIITKKTLKKASDRNLLTRRLKYLYTRSALYSKANTYIISYIAKQNQGQQTVPSYASLEADLQSIIQK